MKTSLVATLLTAGLLVACTPDESETDEQDTDTGEPVFEPLSIATQTDQGLVVELLTAEALEVGWNPV